MAPKQTPRKMKQRPGDAKAIIAVIQLRSLVLDVLSPKFDPWHHGKKKKIDHLIWPLDGVLMDL